MGSFFGIKEKSSDREREKDLLYSLVYIISRISGFN